MSAIFYYTITKYTTSMKYHIFNSYLPCTIWHFNSENKYFTAP